MLRYILLGLLSYRPMTGYELKTLMEQSTGHFWHAYHSQIYTTLRKLEDEGRLSSEELDAGDAKLARRVYTITEAGTRELDAWLAQPLDEPPQVKEDLLVRVFFSARRDPAKVLDELETHRRQHVAKLEEYHRLSTGYHLGDMIDEPSMERDIAFWTMTLRFGITFEQMYIAWLDEAIAQIKQLN